MATSTPFPFREKLLRAKLNAELHEVVKTIIDWYEEALANSDKADYDDGLRYDGQHNAHLNDLALLLGIPDQEFDEWFSVKHISFTADPRPLVEQVQVGTRVYWIDANNWYRPGWYRVDKVENHTAFVLDEDGEVLQEIPFDQIKQTDHVNHVWVDAAPFRTGLARVECICGATKRKDDL